MSELAAMPADWHTALAIVAHPDDLEYGASGAIACWTGEGREVAYLLATRGEAGIASMDPAEAGPLREREQVASAAVVGVDVVEFLDYPDGLIQPTLALRKDLAAAIRRHRPELLLISNHRETWPHGGQNMADHRHVGTAAIDAVRDAGNRWVFRELLEAGLEPWDGVRWVAANSSPHASHAVDITATFEQAVASLRAHEAYLEALGGAMAEPDTFLRAMAEQVGRTYGTALACSFELIEM